MAAPRTSGRLPKPARASCLADAHILVVHVAHLADGGHAVHVYHAHLAGWEAHLGILLVASHKLCAARPRCAPSGRPCRYSARYCVSACRAGCGARGRVLPTRISACSPELIVVANLQTERREDIALLAVGVVDESDASRAVGIVFDSGDFARDAELVALEIDDAIELLVPAATMACGDAARCCCGHPISSGRQAATSQASLFVISSKVATLMIRRPGEVGLYFFTGIVLPFGRI